MKQCNHYGEFPAETPEEDPNFREEILRSFEDFKAKTETEIESFKKNVDHTVTVFLNQMEDRIKRLSDECEAKIIDIYNKTADVLENQSIDFAEYQTAINRKIDGNYQAYSQSLNRFMDDVRESISIMNAKIEEVKNNA